MNSQEIVSGRCIWRSTFMRDEMMTQEELEKEILKIFIENYENMPVSLDNPFKEIFIKNA